MNLRQLVDDPQAPDIALKGLSEHTEEVEAGYGYIAVTRDVSTLLLHCRSAVQRGAGALLLCAPSEQDLGVPTVVVPSLASRRGALAAKFYGEPSADLTCIGVTGTNGKTSIAWHLADLGEHLAVPTAYSGTLGWGALSHLHDATMTTPNAVALQRRLGAMVAAGFSRVALEVSSHALAQKRAAQVQFDFAVFTNLTRDHLDYHGTLTAYGAAKRKLFTDWPLRAAVINVDDPFGLALADAARGQVVTFGRRGDWRWHAEPADTGLRVTWHAPSMSLVADVPLVADFAVSNLTAALATLSVMGHDEVELQSALAQLVPVPGRMERVSIPHSIGPAVVVDYAHTPDALDKALAALADYRRQRGGRLVCVIGCGGDRDRGKRPLMAKVACARADVVWLTSDNPRSEQPERIIADMRAGLKDEAVVAEIIERVDRRQAICEALRQSRPHDVVLIAGKGHENYQEIAGRRIDFDDRVVARKVLTEAGVR